MLQDITLKLHALDICAPDALHKNNIFRVTSDTPITRSAASDNGRSHPHRPRDPDVVIPYRQTRDDSGVVVVVDCVIQLLPVGLGIEIELQLRMRPDGCQERIAILLRINGYRCWVKTLLELICPDKLPHEIDQNPRVLFVIESLGDEDTRPLPAHDTGSRSRDHQRERANSKLASQNHMGVVCILTECQNSGLEILILTPCVNGELVAGRERSLRGVGKNVLTSFLLYFDEQVHQAHVCEVGAIAVVLLVLINVRDVTLVLVVGREQSYVRLNGSNLPRFFDPFTQGA